MKRRLGALALCVLVAGTVRAAGIAQGPYLMRPTTDAITVCWVSDDAATGKVQFRPVGSSEKADLKTVEESAKTRFHRVRLSGLKLYTRYAYIVTCDAQTTAGTFRTAAPLGQPFRFVAYGDNRTQPDKHAAVLARIVAFQPDFVIQTGDQVANGELLPQWEEFFHVADPMLRATAYFPSLGNHEREAAPYFQFFDVPRDYSFDYGNAHFVSLDTNRPEKERAAQDAWLRDDLRAHQGATWRIVFFHHTPYTCVAMPQRRVDAEKLRARLEPIFRDGKVQLVICGHDHNYQHHVAHNIHYVVTGGGGAPLYDVTPDTPFVKTAKKAHHDCEVTVNGSVLSLRAVEPDGTVIETFTVRP